MSRYDDARDTSDDRPADDVPEGRIPTVGDQLMLGKVPYYEHSQHLIECVEVYHEGGRDYKITNTCVTCADGKTWTVSRKALSE